MSSEETTGKCLPCEQNRPTLTIGMATIDDYKGTWATIMALLTYHAEAMGRCEIVVVDNRPNGEHGKLLKGSLSGIKNVRYIPYEGPESSCVPKSKMFEAARGEFVLCLDAHVLLDPGVVAKLLAYYDEHPSTNDLLMGPMRKRPWLVAATHQELVWRGGSFGIWANDPRGIDPTAEPFEIPQQGTGLFSCRKAVWPGFLPEFQGHGGNETWLMEKFRQNGGKVLCVPWLRWLHCFHHPGGSPYLNVWHDRVRNYLTGFNDVNREDWYDQAVAHFKTICPKTTERVVIEIPKGASSFDRALAEWEAAGGHHSGAIPKQLWKAIESHLKPGMRTLEFGSGLSTWLFDRAGTQHTAIEHDERWFDRVGPGLISDTKLWLADLIGKPPWYEYKPEGPFDLILIDGPPGTIGRQGCVEAVPSLCKPGTLIVLDDLHRAPEQYIFDELQDVLGVRGEIHAAGQRKFGVLALSAEGVK